MKPPIHLRNTDYRVPAPVSNESLLVGVAFALAIPVALFVISYPVTLAVAVAFVLGVAARRLGFEVVRIASRTRKRIATGFNRTTATGHHG